MPAGEGAGEAEAGGGKGAASGSSGAGIEALLEEELGELRDTSKVGHPHQGLPVGATTNK